jgi:hypothetical protein
MGLFRKKKLKIQLSKEQVRVAVEQASYAAARAEIHRQIREQLKGTWLEKAKINIPEDQGLLFISPYTKKEWPKVPDSQDLTFEWIGQNG